MAISSERVRAFLLAAAAAFLPAWARAQAVQGGLLPGPLPLFPVSNWWNVDVTSAPVDPNSAAFISWIGTGHGMHPDFGGDSSPSPSIYGMPYAVVPGTEALEPVAARRKIGDFCIPKWISKSPSPAASTQGNFKARCNSSGTLRPRRSNFVPSMM